MRVVIVGCGRVGSRLAGELSAAGHDVRVIDIDQRAFARLDPGFGGDQYIGNGVDEDVLRAAGIEGADAFAAVTNGDNRNIMAAQLAKVIFKVPRVICRIYDPIREAVYRELGLHTMSPTTMGASFIKEYLESN